MDISVIICTYNGADRVPLVLDRLATQSIGSTVEWEVIVVDNNSHDNVSEVVNLYQSKGSLSDKLLYRFEPRQGIAYARRCGVSTAQGQLVAFLDDDNLPSERWLQAVYDFGQTHPQAGAYGGRIVGRYEVEPPQNFKRIACFLAVIDRGDQPFRYDQLKRWLFPAGAGMVVRRDAWCRVPTKPALSGVSGDGLACKGEDIETMSHIRKGGWQIWHNPAMQLEHIIGCDRISAPYLHKLFRGVGLSRYHTRIIRFQRWQIPLAVLAYALKDLYKLAIYYLTYRKILRSDLVAQCEFTLLWNSFVSPFYSLLKIKKLVINWLHVGRLKYHLDSS